MCPTVQRRRRREREDKEVAIGTVVSSSEKQFSSPGSQVFNPFHGGIEANVSLPVCVSATFFFPSSFVPSTHARTHARTRWWPPREAGRRNANSELFADRSLSMSALEVLFFRELPSNASHGYSSNLHTDRETGNHFHKRAPVLTFSMRLSLGAAEINRGSVHFLYSPSWRNFLFP